MSIFVSARRTPQCDARVLAKDEWPVALRIAQQDPVSYILAITHINSGLVHGVDMGELWGFPAKGPVQAVCWMGANLIPIIPDPDRGTYLVCRYGRLVEQTFLVHRRAFGLGTGAMAEPGGLVEEPSRDQGITAVDGDCLDPAH
jgi:hypothetical protein